MACEVLARPWVLMMRAYGLERKLKPVDTHRDDELRLTLQSRIYGAGCGERGGEPRAYLAICG